MLWFICYAAGLLDPLPVSLLTCVRSGFNRLSLHASFTCRLEKKRVDQSESLTLESIRHSLIRQEDSIIFSLLERAQYCYNADTYDRNVFPMDGFHGSLVEFMVSETEKLHARVGRASRIKEIDQTSELVTSIFLVSRLADSRALMSILSSRRIYLIHCCHPCNTHRCAFVMSWICQG